MAIENSAVVSKRREWVRQLKNPERFRKGESNYEEEDKQERGEMQRSQTLDALEEESDENQELYGVVDVFSPPRMTRRAKMPGIRRG